MDSKSAKLLQHWGHLLTTLLERADTGQEASTLEFSLEGEWTTSASCLDAIRGMVGAPIASMALCVTHKEVPSLHIPLIESALGPAGDFVLIFNPAYDSPAYNRWVERLRTQDGLLGRFHRVACETAGRVALFFADTATQDERFSYFAALFTLFPEWGQLLNACRMRGAINLLTEDDLLKIAAPSSFPKDPEAQ